MGTFLGGGTLKSLRKALGLGDALGVLPVECGGTGKSLSTDRLVASKEFSFDFWFPTSGDAFSIKSNNQEFTLGQMASDVALTLPNVPGIYRVSLVGTIGGSGSIHHSYSYSNAVTPTIRMKVSSSGENILISSGAMENSLSKLTSLDASFGSGSRNSSVAIKNVSASAYSGIFLMPANGGSSVTVTVDKSIGYIAKGLTSNAQAYTTDGGRITGNFVLKAERFGIMI